MASPTAEWVVENSNVSFDQTGFGDTVKLERLVAVARRVVARYTGQGWLPDDTFAPTVPLGPLDEPLVADVVLKYVEFAAFRASADVAETLSDFDLISSFSAGSYSESRRNGKDAAEAARAVLKNLFWPIMSPDKQDEWIAQDAGVNPPAFAITEVNWAGQGPANQEGVVGADSLPYPVHETYDPYGTYYDRGGY